MRRLSFVLFPLLLSAACGSVPAGSRHDEPDAHLDDADAGATGDHGATGDAAAACLEDARVFMGVDPPPAPWESLIDPARLHQIEITVEDVMTLETLHGNPDPLQSSLDVVCKLVFDDMVLEGVGIHQKGSLTSGCRCLKLPCTNPTCGPGGVYTTVAKMGEVGQTQEEADRNRVKPSLKLSFDHMITAQRLLGLKKLVLQNGHQDRSFLSAHLTYDLYRRAGLHAPHTAFAQVVINGIPLGLYVLEEDTDKQFLQRNFGDGEGNLYEGTASLDFVTNPIGPGLGARSHIDPTNAACPTFCADAELDLHDENSDMRSRNDVIALGSTILGATDAEFEARVKRMFDLEGFITSWAIDSTVNIHDTYSSHLNNYLLYHDPKTDKVVFLPHGADNALDVGQCFMCPPYYDGLNAFPTPRGSVEGSHHAIGMVSQAVQDIPGLFTRYRNKVKELADKETLWNTQAMLAKVEQLKSLLATARLTASPTDRMKWDIAQFNFYLEPVKKFITEHGVSRRPELMGIAPAPAAPNRVAVIVTSDLFYPVTAATSDNLFDLAVLLSMREVDVKGVVLDNALAGETLPQVGRLEGTVKTGRPGAIAMAQLETVLRKRTPSYIGLDRALTSLGDQGFSDEKTCAADKELFQGGIRFILDTLKKAPSPVTIVTLGSLRDVAAAFNRDVAEKTHLFEQKVARLLVFAGEAASTPAGTANKKDYKVELDHFAFAAIMRSGLPIFWVPREDGGQSAAGHPNNAGNASSFSATLPDVLQPIAGTGPPINFFANGLAAMPVFYIVDVLYYVPDADVMRLLDPLKVVTKDLWAAAALAAVADKTVTYDGTAPALADGLLNNPAGAVFGFSDVDVTVSEGGYVTSYEAGGDSRRMKRFRRLASASTYARAMSLMTGKMLERFALK